jgi:hypothetical protein
MEVTGKKDDEGKPRMELMSSIAQVERARVYTHGAMKYGDNNWRKGLAWSRLIGATLRHIYQWMMGEDNDPETGINHLAHASVSLDFLLEYAVTMKNMDDRYTVVGVHPGPSPFVETIRTLYESPLADIDGMGR